MMCLEEIALSLQGSSNRLGGVNIPLSTIHDGYITESEWNDAARKNVDDVRPLVPRNSNEIFANAEVAEPRTSSQPL